MPFTVVFAAATFLLTPVQAQHASSCETLGGTSYIVEVDSCYVIDNEHNYRGDSTIPTAIRFIDNEGDSIFSVAGSDIDTLNGYVTN
ncbi:MAG: hypothetical protein KME05_12215 [Gloeocapsa sp. UFS-A4-WI-NPMV-4B04]|jgi:hypothetical protein|nr:hypothetical protein [Gloeocapsa sp. UFS-A4-WI-NPMV-4B04]